MADEDRVAEILGDYCDRLERGEKVDPEELIAAHPDLAEELREGLDALRFVDAAFPGSSPDAGAAPREMGDYRILREIGRGGMGVVYEAEQTSMGRRVALKVLSPSVTGAAQSILRFEREARAAGKLHHPNIAPVYGMGKDRGLHYYAMELVEGRSLGEVITELKAEADEATNNCGPFGTTTQGREHFVRLAEAMAGVAEALHAAHEEGVVHRDVKPTNLLLAPDGTLKLVDFGLARLMGEGASMTVTGQILGTPHYMSPEQAMARQIPIDFRTDIYSLGATLYEALTLKTPFTGDSLPAVCSAILHAEPALPRKANPRIPQDLETIVVKAMEKDRERRYASAEEMAKDLRRFAVGMPIRARRIGHIARTWRKVKRNKVRTGLVAAVVVLAALGAYLAQRSASESARLRVADYERLIAEAEDAMPVSMAAREHAADLPPGKTAREILSRAIELCPDRPESYWLRALAEGRTLEERLEDVKRAGERGLSEGTAHLIRGSLFTLVGRREEAEEERRLAALREDGSPVGQFAKARMLAADRRRAEAIELLTRVLDDPRTCAVVRYLSTHFRGKLRVEEEDWPGALDDLLALRKLGDTRVAVRVGIASVWRQLGREDLGAEMFDEALEGARSSEDPGAWSRLMDACQLARELGWLRRAVEEAFERHGEDYVILDARGWMLQYSGRYEEALKIADRLVEIDAGVPIAHLRRGLALRGLGRSEEALAALDRAAGIDPSWSLVHLWRGVVLNNCLGRPERALEAFERAIALDPCSPDAHHNRAMLLENSGRIEEALAAVTRSTELWPECASARRDRWHLLLRLGRRAKTLEEMEGAASRPAVTAAEFHLRGHALHSLGRYGEALEAFGAAIEMQAEGRAGAIWLQRECLLHDRAQALLGARRWKEALAACDEGLAEVGSSKPEAFKIWVARGRALCEMGRHGEALASFEQASSLMPGDPVTLSFWATALYRMGRFEDALAIACEGLKRHPYAAELWTAAGAARAGLGEHEQAREDLEHAIELDPSLSIPYAYLGYLLMNHLGQPEKAVASFRRATELDPQLFEAWRGLVWQRFRLQRFDEALEAADRALAIVPDNAEMLNMRGLILLDHRKDYVAAAETLRQAISFDETNHCYHLNLGLALRGLGKTEAAVKSFGRCLELEQKCCALKALLNRASCYAALGVPLKALADYRRAHELEPGSLSVLYKLVAWSRRLGRLDESKRLAKDHSNCGADTAPPIVLAWLCAVAGEREKGLEAIRRVGPLSSPGDLYNLACVYALLGESEQALAALGRGVEAGYRQPDGAPADPDLESLEQDPRYRALLEQMRGK